MAGSIDQATTAIGTRATDAEIWALVRRQYGVIARCQLLGLGLGARAIDWRVSSGRLHPVWRGVYAVGRPHLGQPGHWMAATLACGPSAMLSHGSAAALWGFGSEREGLIDISVPAHSPRHRPKIRVHRRATLRPQDVTAHERIPVTSPVLTLIDLAKELTPRKLERAVNEADKLDRVRVDDLSEALAHYRDLPGLAPLRKLLDPLTFRLSDSELEMAMRKRSDAARLPTPETKAWVNGYEVDFFWPELGIIVEADGLRYHRTPLQQRRGLERDQAHTASGLRPLRFSHWQIAFDPDYVQRILRRTAGRKRPHLDTD